MVERCLHASSGCRGESLGSARFFADALDGLLEARVPCITEKAGRVQSGVIHSQFPDWSSSIFRRWLDMISAAMA